MRRKPRRLAAEVNAGSMADIAFLLLIFFLVATKIVEDQGIMVKLPPWDDNETVDIFNEDNVLTVKVNLKDQLMVEGLPLQISELREQTKYFLLNPDNLDELPKSPKRAIVSLQNDRGTKYDMYLNVYNELKAAYNELWEEHAQHYFNKSYENLSKLEQRQVRNEIPLVISEAEPSNIEGK